MLSLVRQDNNYVTFNYTEDQDKKNIFKKKQNISSS